MRTIANSTAQAIAAIAETGDVDQMLADFGSAMGVDRAYVFAEHLCNGQLAVSLSNEWCSEHAEPQIELLQNSVIRDIGMQRAMDILHSGAPFIVHAQTMTDTECAHLGPQGIRSMLNVPIHQAGRFRGILGLDACQTDRPWSDDEIHCTHSLAMALALHMERIELQQHADHAARQLDLYAENLRQAKRIGHDLNNALTIISSACDIREPDQDGLGALERRAIDNATRLVQQLRGATRLGLQPARADSIRNAAVGATLNASTEVHLELADDLPAMNMDANDLFRVIDNVVRNASQSMKLAGAVTVAAASLPQPASMVRIVVADEGPGIPSRELGQIFYDRYSSHSSGLGLGICRSIVEQCGGSISVASAAGIGTRVTIDVPVFQPKLLPTK